MSEIMPHSELAEQTVLGAILGFPESAIIDRVIKARLKSNEFYHDGNGLIFSEMERMHGESVPIDLVTLSEALKDNGTLEKVGGFVYLDELSNAVGTAGNVEYYVGIVKEKAKRRKILDLGRDLTKNALNLDSDLDQTIELMGNELASMGNVDINATTNAQSRNDFPDVMKGLAGDFAELYSSYLESPEQFFFMGFLTCLGNAVAGDLTIDSELAPEPRLYTLLLGESADERKSTALKKTVDFFRDALHEFSVCHGIGSAEGLQKKLQENGRLVLVLDEFKAFTSKCRIDSSVLLPCVNTLFEDNRYESRTKNKAVIIEDGHLSLLAASTIQTYERIYDRNFIDIGFTNRVFIVPGTATQKFSIPPKIPESDIVRLKERLVKVQRHVQENPALAVSPEAMKVYDSWYKNRESTIHNKRLDVYALRFMALLAANELKKVVDVEVVKDAMTLADWQLDMRRLHDPIDADSNIAIMEEKIRRYLGKEPKTERDLKRSTHANRAGIWIFENARNNLHRAGEIGWNKEKRKWFSKEL